MIPGEVMPAEGSVTLNEGEKTTAMIVANTGDRPIQVGSHYHFAETNPALDFDRKLAHGMRLDIAAGTAVRFEPGQRREVQLIPIGGARRVFGFNAKVMGPLAVAVAVVLGSQFASGADAQTVAQCTAPQDQATMNACAAQAYAQADAELNTAWKSASTFAKAIGQDNALLEAQRAWLRYRDLACTVQASPFEGGTLQPFVKLECLREVTAARTRMLLDFNAY